MLWHALAHLITNMRFCMVLSFYRRYCLLSLIREIVFLTYWKGFDGNVFQHDLLTWPSVWAFCMPVKVNSSVIFILSTVFHSQTRFIVIQTYWSFFLFQDVTVCLVLYDHQCGALSKPFLMIDQHPEHQKFVFLVVCQGGLPDVCQLNELSFPPLHYGVMKILWFESHILTWKSQ